MIQYNLFPGGKYLALTMSFDDGRIYDRPLVEIFNRYGIKGTFHLNSGKLDQDNYITSNEVKSLYLGHEVACHSVNHMHLEELSSISITQEILEDKRVLEGLVEYPIRGLSYPFGTFDQRVIDIIQYCGIEYSRTVRSTNTFKIPAEPILWDPTVHIKTDLSELWERFINNRFKEMRVFYVWGHSYEFNDNHTWDVIEGFCELSSHHPDVWYATNIEILDYLNALKQLKISVDESMIYNPTINDLWITINNEKVCIPANTLWRKQ